MVANFSDEQLIILKATVLCVAEEITEEILDRISPRENNIRPTERQTEKKEK